MFCNDFLLKQTKYCLSGLVVQTPRRKQKKQMRHEASSAFVLILVWRCLSYSSKGKRTSSAKRRITFLELLSSASST